MGVPFAAVKAAAPRYAEHFCRRYLPAGKRVGHWWVVSVPWREDKNPSLGVNLTSGNWCDFGVPGTHGDLTDLLARVDRCTPAEAASRLALMMGVQNG